MMMMMRQKVIKTKTIKTYKGQVDKKDDKKNNDDKA